MGYMGSGDMGVMDSPQPTWAPSASVYFGSGDMGVMDSPQPTAAPSASMYMDSGDMNSMEWVGSSDMPTGGPTEGPTEAPESQLAAVQSLIEQNEFAVRVFLLSVFFIFSFGAVIYYKSYKRTPE